MAGASRAQPTQDWVRTETRDDCTDYDPLRQPLFGETHVHTALSLDARLFRVRTDPFDAYNFAAGGVQDLPPYDGMGVAQRTFQLNRPLDFAMVSDHAEGFGENRICEDNGYAGYNAQICQDTRALIATPSMGFPETIPAVFFNWFAPLQQPNPSRYGVVCGSGDADCTTAASLVWQETQDAAEAFYDRSDACAFTTFVGYEWTGNPAGDGLHRNILFRNEQVPAAPISVFEADTPGELFDALDAACTDAPGDCDLLSIPHNSNVSGGLMFSPAKLDLTPYDAEDAAQRARLETLVEIYQLKGSSECRFGVGNKDEDCGFETLYRLQNFSPFLPNADFKPLNYVREGLKEGLRVKQSLGVNPFEFGVIAATDGHSNLPGSVDEEDYANHGGTGEVDSDPVWRLDNSQTASIEGGSGGLAVVWAEENSRDAIFAAMRRREAYGTSGPRIGLRFFGGRMPDDLCDDPDLVAEGYNRGVPMGGELGPVGGPKSPSFAILATKDPGGSGDPSVQLQRVQVVKGYVDKNGDARERVFDVAGTSANKSDAGVDLDTCTPTGGGHDSLCTVWSDPSFKASEDAFYYVRVLQNPTCRWHQYVCNDGAVDCSDLGSVPAEYIECCNDAFWPDTIQERAWSSPIFYIPEEMGIAKAQIKYGKNPGEDRAKISLVIGRAGDDLDPTANALGVVLSDDDDIINATFPAGALVDTGKGTVFKYKDRTGSIAGITTAVLKRGVGKASKLLLKTGKTDLSAADANDHTVSLTLSIGGYTSTDTTPWQYTGKSLIVPK